MIARTLRSAPLLLLVAVVAACSSSGGPTVASAPSSTAAAVTTTSGAATPTTAAAATTTTAAALKVTGLVKDGVLTVGTELPAPPFFVGDDYDKITGGFEVDLATEMAKRLGLTGGIKVVNMPFTGIVAGQKCPCDIDFSQITINAERSAKVSFTSPYFNADQGVLVNKGFKVPDLATAKGLRWGAQAETTGFDKVKEITGKEPKTYDTVTAAFTALKAKQIDAVMLDVPIVAGEAGQAGSTFEVAGKLVTNEQYGAIVSDKANTAAFSSVIDTLKKEGFLDTLVAKYFPAAANVAEIK